MTTANNPYSVPESPQRFDAFEVYQQSFFSLIWPSVAWAVFIIGSSLAWELTSHQALPLNSLMYDLSPVLLLLWGLTIPAGAYFLTARRLMRHDGQQRSTRRSLAIAVSMTFFLLVSGLVSLLVAGVIREMIETNDVNRIAISITVVPAVCTAVLAFVFKRCWREIHVTRFVTVSIGSISIIMLIAFSHPLMPEMTRKITWTFFATVMSLISHFNCFAWWYATPKVSAADIAAKSSLMRPAETAAPQF